MKKRIMLSVLALVVVVILTGIVLIYQFVWKPEHRVYEVAPITERLAESGRVVGFIENNGTHAWLGIPYAKAPVGELRWRAPRPSDPWEGTLEAVELSPICTQYGGLMGDVSPLAYGDPVGQEDCLFLNLWAPALSPDAIPQGGDRLPVMVWIHGGGNSVGHGGTYNGRVLADMYKVIVVTFNYRLGPLGWFAHPALRGEGTTAEDKSGNYGTLDVIRALSWVRDNISRFGGDPERVTVFGESAGARNTITMLLSPKARGLVHRAIVQSGGSATTVMSKAENYKDAASPGHRFSSREVVCNLLIADGIAANREGAKAYQDEMSNEEIAEYLGAKSSREMFRAYEPVAMGMISMPQVFRDGAVLPKGDPMTLFRDRAGYNPVPVILGTNRDENKLFMSMNPEYVGILGVRDQEYYDLIAGYVSQGWKATGADEIAVVLRETQGASVYVYRFDWDEEPSILGSDMGKVVGAGHGLEIAFVFNEFEAGLRGLDLFFYADSNEPGRRALADDMSSYWAEFAYTGSPGKGRDGNQTEWTAWDNAARGDKLIIFDTPEGGGIRMSSDAVRLADLKKRIRAETRFKSQQKHCETYVRMFAGQEEWDSEAYENLGKEGCRDYPRELFEW